MGEYLPIMPIVSVRVKDHKRYLKSYDCGMVYRVLRVKYDSVMMIT